MIHVLKIILNEVCNKCDIHSILREYCLTCKSFWKVMLIWFISLKRMSSDYMLKTLNILTLNVNIIFLWKFFQNNINIALLPSLIGKYLSVWDIFWRDICLYVFYMYIHTQTHRHTHTHTHIYICPIFTEASRNNGMQWVFTIFIFLLSTFSLILFL